MAKAQFHKNQRVYVKTVGTWSAIEKVLPQWAKGIDEPLRIFYDVGLGRDFAAEELQSDQVQHAPVSATAENGVWCAGAISGSLPKNARITPTPAPIRRW